MGRAVILLGLVMLCLGSVLFVVALVPDPVGKAIADPFCDGELVIVENTRNSFELLCQTLGTQTSFTGTFIAVAMIGVLGGIGLMVLTLVWRLRASAKEQRRLLAEGVPAQARVLDVTQTASQINNQPVIKFRLEVQQPGSTPFETELRTIVSLVRVGRIIPGMTIPVMIDPDNPKQVAIDWDRLPTPGGMDATLKEKLTQLDQSMQAGLISQDEYEDARKRLLSNL